MIKTVEVFPFGHLWIRLTRTGVDDQTFAILVEKNGTKHPIASGPVQKGMSLQLDKIADSIRLRASSR